MTRCAFVAAVDRAGLLGVDGRLPWRLPTELKRFRALTLGHAVVYGRRTFDAIGRPLDQRTNIVLSRDPRWRREGVLVARSLDEALALAAQSDPLPMVLGGAEVFAAAFSRCVRVHLTVVDHVFEAPAGAVYFPPWEGRWTLEARERVTEDAYAYDVCRYERA